MCTCFRSIWSNKKDIYDLTHILKEIEHFFQVYKDLEERKSIPADGEMLKSNENIP